MRSNAVGSLLLTQRTNIILNWVLLFGAMCGTSLGCSWPGYGTPPTAGYFQSAQGNAPGYSNLSYVELFPDYTTQGCMFNQSTDSSWIILDWTRYPGGFNFSTSVEQGATPGGALYIQFALSSNPTSLQRVGHISVTGADQTLTLTVTQGACSGSICGTTLTITTTSLPNGAPNSPYPPQTLTATGGVPPYTWSVTNLPIGLTFNSQTDAIGGTPTQNGQTNVTLQVVDSLGNSTSKDLPLTIATGTTGIDLSQFPSNWTPLATMLTDVDNDPTDAVGNPVGPPQFVIADAWGGSSIFPASLILSSAPSGLLKAAYAVLSYGNPSLTGATQINNAFLGVGTQEQANLGFMAVDVESASTLASDPQSIANRNNTIAQAIQAVQDAGLKAVIYTNSTYWNNITGGTTSFGCIPLWRVLLPYDDIAEVNFTSEFGGWTQAVGKQYQTVENGSATELAASGVSAVDLDVFTDLSIFTPGISCAANPQGCMAEDVTSSVSISRSGFRYNFGTQSFDQTLTLVNNAATSLAGPLSLVFDNLSSAVIANETAYSQFGSTSCTYPRLSVYLNVLSSALAPGQSVAVPIQFKLTGNAGITYTSRVLSGKGAR